MGVYIKGMEMPIDCEHCLLCEQTTVYGGRVYQCLANDKWVDEGYQNQIMKDCPLLPVPLHGDLIDKKTVSENLASVLNKKNPPFSYPDWNDAIVAMLTAPTIIPANEEGET